MTNAEGIVCEVLDKYDMYVIEYKPAVFNAKKKSAQKPVLEGTVDKFHARFGREKIKHLPDAVEGIKID